MINNLNDKTTVVYSSDRINRLYSKDPSQDPPTTLPYFDPKTLGAKELFVNGNAPNHLDVMLDDFTLKSNVFSTAVINEDAYPILLFQTGDQMVAWYDEENEHGYIA